MHISFPFKKIIIVTVVVAIVVVVYLVYALAGLAARPVVFADPPAFVERYAAEIEHTNPPTLPKEFDTGGGHVATSEFAQLTADLSKDEALVFNVIMDGESFDVLLRLFSHPDKAQRVKVASALAAVNVKFSHNEETGFAEKRRQFWLDVDKQLPDIRNALSEALIASAEEGTATRIPYTLAWLPGQGHETVEVLAWAAKHHSDPWVRRFSVYFVVKFGGDEDIAGPLLRDRTHDPAYVVRKEVLVQRFRRFIAG